MNLVEVSKKSANPFTATCIKCGHKSQTDREQFYADTQGKPFVDYYCDKCGSEIKYQAESHRIINRKF